MAKAKAIKSAPKTKRTPAPKVKKQVVKKERVVKEPKQPQIRKKDKQKAENNRRLLKVNVDAKILDILNSSPTEKLLADSFKQLATQLGVNSMILHTRKKILENLTSMEKQYIQDAQKVIL